MKLSYMDIAGIQSSAVHGHHYKDLIVAHETVSPDYPGWQDILGVSNYLDMKDYGIHGITDLEGHIAYAHGLGDAVFWQCGGVNERSIGIEQVSRVMIQYPTDAKRKAAWLLRQKELKATAKLIASISNSRKNPDGSRQIPLQVSKWDHAHQMFTPGVVSHYEVSQHYKESEGHTDCKPVHLGGYYPLYQVVFMARTYAKAGYHV